MNKTAIKNYAVEAHRQLVDQIIIKAFQFNVTEASLPEMNSDSVNGKLLSNMEKSQLNALIKAINQHGFKHVMEEVAYTWFNRFIALRFMEVNNYLPQKVRVFTNENNEFKPELLTEAIHIELDGLDKQKVFDYIEDNNQEDLYKYLLLTICNDMNQYLPDMFTSIDKQDYKILLFPDGILKEDSVIAKLIEKIPEEDWMDKKEEMNNNEPSNAVTMIGWLYQYYISERHNEVINILKGTVKKEDIPAATELFTTDWVVRYMVDNSLGRYWIERNPNSELKSKLKFLATAKDGSLPIVDNEPKKPEELTFFDPCMGSGHILSYAFDVLMEIYRGCGWTDRDAAISIVENNLYGLDIDDRAYQLSYFAIMMKGCKYNRRFLKLGVKNHLSNIVETNDLHSLSYVGMKETGESKDISNYLLTTFKDAVELGSLIKVDSKDYLSYEDYIDNIHEQAEYSLDSLEWMDSTYFTVKKLVKQADILSRKYCITTTNPPYMSKMDGNLKNFVIKNYKDYSSDLFAVFVKRNFDFTVENGYLGFMTPFVWMFIKSYEKLREYIINNKFISTLVQMEYSAYEEATVPICSYVLKNKKSEAVGYYFRLSDFKGGMEVQKQKVLESINNKNCGYFYEAEQSDFSKIPGFPIAYWVSKKGFLAFSNSKIVDHYVVRNGISTGNNGKYLRLWHEVSAVKDYWKPCNKGGSYRKWYGNNEYYVYWKDDGHEIKTTLDDKGRIKARLGGVEYSFSKGIEMSRITSGRLSFRISNGGFIYESSTNDIYQVNNEYSLIWLLGYCNSKVVDFFLNLMNPTINIMPEDIRKLPCEKVKSNFLNDMVNENIDNSKKDWDSYETSWDFKVHPLVKNHVSTISEAYNLWSKECEDRFKTLKKNEEELNRIFIDIYGLQDELNPYVEDKAVTVRRADLVRDVKSFISYAVGCMFGRYSLDKEGLVFAGGSFDDTYWKCGGEAALNLDGSLPPGDAYAGVSLAKLHYAAIRDNDDYIKATKLKYEPDIDDIIPICDEDYFEDDIVTRFVGFVKCAYGEDTLGENLQFIANSLGGKGAPRDVLRNYFLNDFFKDHCKIYQKLPIYWLFDSGKKNGFKALVYIHRYTPDLIARMRTGYIHPLQSQYRTQIDMLNSQIEEAASTSEKVKLQKQLKKITEQSQELGKYEEKIHHWADKMEPMDLDDGVKVNYAKFQNLLAKIK